MTLHLQSKATSIQDLLRRYGEILMELRCLNVTTTNDSPVGGYGEWLVCQAFGGERQCNSNKSVDVVTADRTRLQVKTRWNSASAKSVQLGAIRSLDADGFDYLVAVILSADFSVACAYRMPTSLVRRFARYVKHTNSHRLVLTAEIVADPECLDVTERLRALQAE